jgi:hypothetical protein
VVHGRPLHQRSGALESGRHAPTRRLTLVLARA